MNKTAHARRSSVLFIYERTVTLRRIRAEGYEWTQSKKIMHKNIVYRSLTANYSILWLNSAFTGAMRDTLRSSASIRAFQTLNDPWGASLVDISISLRVVSQCSHSTAVLTTRRPLPLPSFEDNREKFASWSHNINEKHYSANPRRNLADGIFGLKTPCMHMY